MILPNNNITTNLVSTTLGHASNNVGVLCTSNKINKWSKNKPINFNKLFNLTDVELLSQNYGLTVSSSTNYKGLSDWTYIRPTGVVHHHIGWGISENIITMQHHLLQ